MFEILTATFVFFLKIFKRLCWNVYLKFTRLPLNQAWMDPREQDLMIKHIEQTGTERKSRNQSVSMVEFGSGSSTFFFSRFVDFYVSIEHSPDYCIELERMASLQNDRSVQIFYMGRRKNEFFVKRTFEKISSGEKGKAPIEIYCVPRNAYSIVAYWKWAIGARSSYSMYRDYVDFLSIYFPQRKFDLAFIDGRARPQVAYALLKQFQDSRSKLFVHDWNQRSEYHIIEQEFYRRIDEQIESQQIGGGGLVVLVPKFDENFDEPIDRIQWKHISQPSWWL